VADNILARLARERASLSKEMMSSLSFLINYVEIYLLDDAGLKAGLDRNTGADVPALAAPSSPMSALSALKLYSKDSTSLLTRIVDLFDYLTLTPAIDSPLISDIFRIIICSLHGMTIELAQSAAQTLLQYIKRAPSSVSINKYAMFFVLWGLDNAVETINKRYYLHFHHVVAHM
jgi:hypothetical protein